MTRTVHDLIVYGSPILMFLVLSLILSRVVGFSVIASLGVSALIALLEFGMLRFVFSRVFPNLH